MKSLLSEIMRLISIAVPPQLGNMRGQPVTVLVEDTVMSSWDVLMA